MADKINILIAEHDPVDIDLLEFELKNAGINYAYKVVQNIHDFINSLTCFIPDIILSNYTFPSFDGASVFEAKEKLAPHIPFIFISEIRGILSLVKNIADSKNNEVEKHRTEARYQTLVNTIDGIVWEANVNPLQFTFISHQIENVLGYTQQQWLEDPKFYVSKIHPDDRKWVSDYYAKMTAEKKPYRFEYRMIAADGRVVWLNDIISVITESSGSVIIRGITTDITIRKKAAELLKHSEQRYRTLFEQNLAGIYHSSLAGVINCNQAFAKMLKYDSPEQLLKITATDLYFSPEERNDFINTVIKQKKLYNYESILKCKDGSKLYVIENISLQKDEISGEEFCVGILIDNTERKLAELRLTESHAKYKAIIDNSMNAFLLSDTDGNILEVNDTTCKTLGYTKEELLKLNRKDILEVDSPDYEEAVDIRKKTGVAVGEVYGIRKTGERFPIYFTTSVFYTAEGEERLSSIGVDITDKKKAEEKLLKSHERYINVSKATFDAIWDWDVHNNYLYLGDGFKELFGYESHNGNSKFSSWSDHIHPEDKERVLKDRLNKIINHDESSWTDNYRYMRADGSVAYVSDRGILLRSEVGTYRMIGAMQDVTKLKHEEQRIIEVFKEKNSILESIGDAFFAVDKNWTVTYWNNQAEKMLRIKKDDIIGHNLWQVFSHLIGSESYKKYHEAIETGEVIHFDDYDPQLNTWYEISAYPSETGLSVYFRDISDRKLSEIRLNEMNDNLQKQAKKLAVSNEELERYAYVTSHDLQEPLRMVTSFLQLLQKKYDTQLDETAQKYINFAVDGAARMKTLILDLLEFSRISSFVEDHQMVDINNVVSKTCQTLKAVIDENNAVINVSLLPTVCGNESQLMQLFQNLISNAIKYKRNVPPVVYIGYTETAEEWCFYVQDNGIGINEKFYEKVFIIFQRLHNRKQYEGTGIGLAICKKIVELHGGKIWIESSVGEGSKFYFTILKSKTSNMNESEILCTEILPNS